MKTIDLCSGIGGIRRGFELAGGFMNVMSAETDPFACKTYAHLFHDDPFNDVTDEKFKEKICRIRYDVLLAGFPCQAFSRVGQRLGFKDRTKGTIFFDVADIISRTKPKVVFLENVENLVSHDGGNTFRVIIETLENELNYHVIGIKHGSNGELQFDKHDFIRNTKNFGLPQNRPRVYIIGFSRDYFGKHVEMLPERTPTGNDRVIFDSVTDILDTEVDGKFFLSSGLLETLKNHKIRQKKNGNGFGYRIVNTATEGERCISSTILATGGSGKERNLIYDPENGRKYAGMMLEGKKSPVNTECIRTMTPSEWGRLQGFIGYGFLDGNGNETFSFPEGMSDTQKFKQFGNSVSIPVIETMACFIMDCVRKMENEFTDTEREIYRLSGSELMTLGKIREGVSVHMHGSTLGKYGKLIRELGIGNDFGAEDISRILGISKCRAHQIISGLNESECVKRCARGVYRFTSENRRFLHDLTIGA